MTFEQGLETDPAYMKASLYMTEIQQHLRFFKRDAFLFLLLDDLRESPNRVLQSLQRFLGVEERDLHQGREIMANKAGAEHYLWFEMMRRIEAHPGLLKIKSSTRASIRKMLFSGLKRSPIGRQVMDSYQLPAIRRETRQRVLNVFRKPNEELAAFLGRDLSSWPH